MSCQQRPRYAGQDVRPTSKKELLGWYAYGLAGEVFAICAVGSFLPVVLEQSAREMGVLRSDPTRPCQPTMEKAKPNDQCVVHFLGAEINTASFAMYTFAVAVLVQAIILVSISAIADHGNYRKRLLLLFACIGSATGMLFIVVRPQLYLLGSLLVIIGIPCLGSSFVLQNSFLPLLVANHPSAQAGSFALTKLSSEDQEDLEDVGHHTPLTTLPPELVPEPRLSTFVTLPSPSPELQLSNQISAKGVSVGYAAGVTVQVMCIVILVLFAKLSPATAKTTFPLRLILFVVGSWWACFTIPTALWLRPRPGPPLAVLHSQGRWKTVLTYVVFSWKSLAHTIRLAWTLKQSVKFLVAWFLLSDSIATVQGAAVLFAKNELKMDTASIGGISILATVGGIIGAATWPGTQRRMNWKSNHVVVACMCLLEIIPVYGLLSLIPFVKGWGVGGMQKPWEIFPMAFIVGFAMGGISSYCRSVYGILIPPGHEAAFYALYAFTDKGSSVIGPTIVGRIVDKTGSIRTSFFFLAVLNLLPIPLVMWTDLDSGRQDALEMARRLDESKARTIEDETEDEEREGFLHRTTNGHD